MKFVDASAPDQSPTRVPAVSDKPQSAPDAKKMHDEICAEYQAKHGMPPDLEYVMREVFKRRGVKL